MPTSVLGLLTAEAHKALPMPSYAYGLFVVLGFGLLLALTWAFRGAATDTRRGRATTGAAHGGQH